MADLNEVRLIGRLTRDPELRSTPTGQYVCSFGLATNRKYRRQDGANEEETTFIEIVCWGKTAQNVNSYLRKGSSVFIGGRLQYDAWTDQNTGQKRSRLRVIGSNIQFLDRKSDAPPAGGGGYYARPQAYSPPQAPMNPPIGGPAPTGDNWTPSGDTPSWEDPGMDMPTGMDEPPF